MLTSSSCALCGSFVEDFNTGAVFCVTASANATCRSISSSNCLCNFLTSCSSCDLYCRILPL
uniref:Uncharacterized protein n=1 Tax=Arundo donax TaxID=35708 RepID=A0A0A9FK78_ARUDO